MGKKYGMWATLLPLLASCVEGPEGAVTLADAAAAADGGVVVRDDNDAEVVCGAELALRPKSVALWPPNHKLHEISVADCIDVVGACPGDPLLARFAWVSSDEPVDARGDGNHAPDVVLSEACDVISLRSERQGPSNGRVYTLGVQLTDATGTVFEAACTAYVAHDQSGRAPIADADAYRIDIDGSVGAPECGAPSVVLF
jgi:hypothetical protein